MTRPASSPQATTDYCRLVWADGEMLDLADARVSPLDHSVLVGDGVFETCKIIDRTPFALSRHLQRLRFSATSLGIEPPTSDIVGKAALAVIDANSDAGHCPTRLRITVTSGSGPLGSARGVENAKLFIAAAVTPHPVGPADVITVPWARNDKGALVGLKTTSYAENVMAIERAHAEGATEALFPNTVGNLCEGTGSNVFVILDDQLVTPPLSAGCLAGITRQLVLDTTTAVERDITMEEFLAANEAFLTSSTRDVMPISTVDGNALPTVDGPLTQQARLAFAALVEETLDPR